MINMDSQFLLGRFEFLRADCAAAVLGCNHLVKLFESNTVSPLVLRSPKSIGPRLPIALFLRKNFFFALLVRQAPRRSSIFGCFVRHYLPA